MKKLTLSLCAMLAASCLIAGDNTGLTNQEKINKSIASAFGSTLRHRQMPVSGCQQQFQTQLELQSCEEGYKKVDEMLKSRD